MFSPGLLLSPLRSLASQHSRGLSSLSLSVSASASFSLGLGLRRGRPIAHGGREAATEAALEGCSRGVGWRPGGRKGPSVEPDPFTTGPVPFLISKQASKHPRQNFWIVKDTSRNRGLPQKDQITSTGRRGRVLLALRIRPPWTPRRPERPTFTRRRTKSLLRHRRPPLPRTHLKTRANHRRQPS